MNTVYKKDGSYAREHGELALFRQSAQINRDCVGTLEAAIRDGWDGAKMNADIIHHVVDTFGKERVEFILANTIVNKMYDGRFARSNKEWAKTIVITDPVPQLVVNSHSTIVDRVVNIVRRYEPEPNLDFNHAIDATELEAAKSAVSAYKMIWMPTVEWIAERISRHPKEFAPTGEPEYNIGFSTAYRGNTINISASCVIDLQECRLSVGIPLDNEDPYDALTAYEDIAEPWFRAVCENLQLQLLQGILIEIENIDQMDIERAALDELIRDNY